MSARPLTVLVAPDSFKGSLTSVEVARAIADGWSRARPEDEVLLAPLADGGEGTLTAIEASGGWTRESTTVAGPDLAPVDAAWLRSADGSTAVVEMAAASGLSLIRAPERNTSLFSSLGTGGLIRAVVDAGVRDVTLGIGGSATTDGGAGILAALGAVFVGADGEPVAEPPTPPLPVALDLIARADLSGLDPRLADIRLRVACDVTNPLLGPTGAAATYGPQKGASPSDVQILDANLATFADALERATARRERATPGAGAAGGVGFALLAIQDRFWSFALEPGVELVMDATGFDEKLARADLVITGEGRIDAQTAFGKTALGVAKRGHEAGIPVIALGGGVTPEGIDALAPFGVVVVPVSERPQSVEGAMSAGVGPVERCAERVARLIGFATRLA